MSISESILSEEKLNKSAPATETAASGAVNTTTKAELFSRAKTAIGAGESSLREAAEALALAQEDFNATQREIAAAVGKSLAWVNRLLQWQREGCQGTPFGPGSKAGRERRKRVQATEQRASRTVDEDDAGASAERRKDENAKLYGEPGAATPGDDSSANSGGDDARALAEFKKAADHWLPRMSQEAKCEAVRYVLKQSGVPAP